MNDITAASAIATTPKIDRQRARRRSRLLIVLFSPVDRASGLPSDVLFGAERRRRDCTVQRDQKQTESSDGFESILSSLPSIIIREAALAKDRPRLGGSERQASTTRRKA
jgi:hypothetical protein